MARRIAYRLFPGVAILLVVGTALGQGCKPLKTNKRRNGIARPTQSYGSTQEARTITLRGTLGTVAHSAVLTRAKLRPTKTACALGQVQNEGDPATAETRRKQNVRPVAHHARWPKLSRRQADDRLLRWQFAIIIAPGNLRPC